MLFSNSWNNANINDEDSDMYEQLSAYYWLTLAQHLLFFLMYLAWYFTVVALFILLLFFFRYQLIRASARGTDEGCKWLEMFEDARAIIFCVDLSDYDQHGEPVHGKNKSLTNRIMQSKELFETTVRCRLTPYPIPLIYFI